MVLGCILCDQPLVTRIQPGAPCKPSRRVFARGTGAGAGGSKAKGKSKPKSRPHVHVHAQAHAQAQAPDPGAAPRHPFQPYQPSATRLGLGPIVNCYAGASPPAGANAFGSRMPSYVCPPPSQNDYEVLATKCGHMFHRVCLKTYIATRNNPAMGNKRPCPFCDKFISLSHCVPIQLIVPKEHLILDELSALLQQNDSIQQQIEYMRTVVQAEKLRELAVVQEEVRKKERELQLKCAQLERQRTGADDEELQQLQQENETVEKETQALAAENRQLIDLIEQAVKMSAGGADIDGNVEDVIRNIVTQKPEPEVPAANPKAEVGLSDCPCSSGEAEIGSGALNLGSLDLEQSFGDSESEMEELRTEPSSSEPRPLPLPPSTSEESRVQTPELPKSEAGPEPELPTPEPELEPETIHEEVKISAREQPKTKTKSRTGRQKANAVPVPAPKPTPKKIQTRASRALHKKFESGDHAENYGYDADIESSSSEQRGPGPRPRSDSGSSTEAGESSHEHDQSVPPTPAHRAPKSGPAPSESGQMEAVVVEPKNISSNCSGSVDLDAKNSSVKSVISYLGLRPSKSRESELKCD